MKVAIYVEGITEAAFVYQLIKEHYQSDWTAFRLECLNLDPQEAAKDLRNYGDEAASDYFLIYDSCSSLYQELTENIGMLSRNSSLNSLRQISIHCINLVSAILSVISMMLSLNNAYH